MAGELLAGPFGAAAESAQSSHFPDAAKVFCRKSSILYASKLIPLAGISTAKISLVFSRQPSSAAAINSSAPFTACRQVVFPASAVTSSKILSRRLLILPIFFSAGILIIQSSPRFKHIAPMFHFSSIQEKRPLIPSVRHPLRMILT